MCVFIHDLPYHEHQHQSTPQISFPDSLYVKFTIAWVSICTLFIVKTQTVKCKDIHCLPKLPAFKCRRFWHWQCVCRQPHSDTSDRLWVQTVLWRHWSITTNHTWLQNIFHTATCQHVSWKVENYGCTAVQPQLLQVRNAPLSRKSGQFWLQPNF